MTICLHIAFAEHVPANSRDSMTSGIAAYGVLTIDPSQRNVTVEIAHPSKLKQLKQQLTAWERHGLLRWTSDQNSN